MLINRFLVYRDTNTSLKCIYNFCIADTVFIKTRNYKEEQESTGCVG